VTTRPDTLGWALRGIVLAAGIAACGEERWGQPDAGPASGDGGSTRAVGVLSADGGSGDRGSSGSSGRGGALAIRATAGGATIGELDATARPSWTRPEVSLGAHPFVLSTSGTVSLAGRLRGFDGLPATALWVKPGVEVRLEDEDVALQVDGPVVIEGQLTVARPAGRARDGGSLSIRTPLFVLGPEGWVKLAGDAVTEGAAGDGGRLEVIAPEAFVFGIVQARGGNAESRGQGGRGGSVRLGAAGPGGTLVVTGILDVLGGLGSERGGDAGEVEVVGDGAVHVSGRVLAFGGLGPAGGQGGNVRLRGGARTVVSGSFELDGGSDLFGPPEGDPTTWRAGNGGSFEAGPSSGGVWFDGVVDARGGSSIGLEFGGFVSDLPGGRGGLVRIGAGQGAGPPGPLCFSGFVWADGGLGTDGGDGGTVELAGSTVRASARRGTANGASDGGPGVDGGGGTIAVASTGVPSAVGVELWVAGFGAAPDGTVTVDGLPVPLEFGVYRPATP